mmetsp:Transcript_32360/g.75343  ORF Transcript_32360/g.75343 Transcript_32360/m.75343 type:complete len:210 (-) Transcript_32360:3047-3676(-)
MFLRVARGLLGAVNVSLLESRNVRAFCTCVAPTGHSVAGAPGEQRKRLSPNCSTRYSVLTKFSPNTSTVSPPVVYPPTGETAVMRIGWWKRNCCSEYPNCCPFHVRATVASPHVGQAVVGVLRMAEEEEEETDDGVLHVTVDEERIALLSSRARPSTSTRRRSSSFTGMNLHLRSCPASGTGFDTVSCTLVPPKLTPALGRRVWMVGSV